MKTVLAIITLITCSFSAIAQAEYETKMEQDGIKVTYQWRPSDKKTPDSQLELDIVLTNTSDHASEVSFTVTFLDAGEIMEESAPFKLCVKAGKSLKGKKYGLSLISETITNEQISSNSFDWALEEFKVKEAKECE